VVKIFTRMLDNVVEVNGLRWRSSVKKSCASAVTAWVLGIGFDHHHAVHEIRVEEVGGIYQNVSREMAVAGWEAALILPKRKVRRPS